jgi:predicted peptidase
VQFEYLCLLKSFVKRKSVSTQISACIFLKNKVILNGCMLLLVGTVTLAGQNTITPGRYTNPNYFADDVVLVKDNVVYGAAKDWQGNSVNLDMKIFYPDMAYDSLKKRPLIMLMHGGSYWKGSKNEEHNLAIYLAKRGFVAVSINYRLGWNHTVYWTNKWDTTFYMAVYRSVQDSKAALRFLVNKASKYGIDTTRIFIGGLSAGAATALYTAHSSQLNWDEKFPWIRKKLGALDSSTNNLHDKYTLKGLWDMWGGIGDTSYISSASAMQIPIVIFHGTADSIMPYTKSSMTNADMVPFFGGYLIAQRYKHLNGCYQLNIDKGGGHGMGFSYILVADKIGSFYKSLIEGTCRSEEVTICH